MSQVQTEREKDMTNELIEEIFEADSAGWTITDIAEDLKISRQEIIDLYLRYERYEPNDPELNS